MRDTLIIGHGLIGKALERASAPSRVRIAENIQWENLTVAVSQLESTIWQHIDLVGEGWRIAWCAGRGMISMSEQQMRAESALVTSVATQVLSSWAPAGAFLFTSSAGGLYQGNGGTVNEWSRPLPLSFYGSGKAHQEMQIEELAAGTQHSVIIARPTNAFGPNQNPAKPQGVITKMMQACLTGEPVMFTADPATTRDYVAASDIGREMDRLFDIVDRRPGILRRIIASGIDRTLGDVGAAVVGVTGEQFAITMTESAANEPTPSTSYRPLDGVIRGRGFERTLNDMWNKMKREQQ